MDSHQNEIVRNVKITDCTLRDGGHLNNWTFDRDFVSRVVWALAETNINAIEVGYVSKKECFPADTGIWRFCEEKDVRSIVPADIQSKIAVMGDIGKVGIEQFIPKDESVIDIVRLAFYPGQSKEAIELGHEVLDLGYEVYLNCMGTVCYDEAGLKELMRELFESKISNIVIADSFGSLMPRQVYNLVQLFKKGTGKNIGYHAHNNLEMAFANTIASIEAGAASVDATIYGIGRGAGNLPIEVLLAHLLHFEGVHTNIIPLLEIIESDFVPLREELKWGYNLHYMISGLLKCHPNYASTLLDGYKMDMPSVWANLVEISRKKPVKFDKKLLHDVIEKGKFSNEKKLDSRMRYSNIKVENIDFKAPDYQGRHSGRDFLVLGNGPSLKTDIEKIKKLVKEKDLVVIGANYLHGLIEPDYHAFNNINRFLRYGKFTSSKSRLLIGSYISDSIVRSIIDKEFERLPYVNTNNEFGIENGVIQSNCGTISVLLIASAIIMGARKIYVAGLDGYKQMNGNKTHFYSETQETPTNLESISLNEVCDRYLNEIREYQIENDMEPFRIITKTSYTKHYDGGILE